MPYTGAHFRAAHAAGQAAREQSNNRVVAAMASGPSVFPLLSSGITESQFATLLCNGIEKQRKANEKHGVTHYTGLIGYAYKPAHTQRVVNNRQPQNAGSIQDPEVHGDIPFVDQQQPALVNQEDQVINQPPVALHIPVNLVDGDLELPPDPEQQESLVPGALRAARNSTPIGGITGRKRARLMGFAEAPPDQVPQMGSRAATPFPVRAPPGSRGRGRPRKYPTGSAKNYRAETPAFDDYPADLDLTTLPPTLHLPHTRTPVPHPSSFITPRNFGFAPHYPAIAPAANFTPVAPTTSTNKKRSRTRSTSSRPKKRLRQRRAESEESMSSNENTGSSSPIPILSDGSDTDVEMEDGFARIKTEHAEETEGVWGISPANSSGPTRKSSRPHNELNYMQQIEDTFAGLSDELTSSDVEPESEVGKVTPDDEDPTVEEELPITAAEETGTNVTPGESEEALAGTPAPPNRRGRKPSAATNGFSSVSAVSTKPKRKYTKRAKAEKDNAPVINVPKKRGRPPKNPKPLAAQTMPDNSAEESAEPKAGAENSDEPGVILELASPQEVPKAPGDGDATTMSTSSTTNIVMETPEGESKAITEAAATAEVPATPKSKKTSSAKSVPGTPSKYMLKKAASIPVKPKYIAVISRVHSRIGRGRQFKYLISFAPDDNVGTYYTETKMRLSSALNELMERFDAVYERVEKEDVNDVRFTGQEEQSTGENEDTDANGEVAESDKTKSDGEVAESGETKPNDGDKEEEGEEGEKNGNFTGEVDDCWKDIYAEMEEMGMMVEEK